MHLWWNTKNLNDATTLYGEVTVLETHHAVYYCGANWHPSEPAGGYCGIQHNGPTERRTIFSVWDTSRMVRAKVTQADPDTVFDRFDNEGDGAHTHMLWNWHVGEKFQFFVEKCPGIAPGTTDVRYYVHDRHLMAWRHSATITSPNGTKVEEASVATIGGGALGSFLENFAGKDLHVPKLALYRLWIGHGPDALQSLTTAQGRGIWGQLGDSFFLAEGAGNSLEETFARLRPTYGVPVFGYEGQMLGPVPDRALSPELKNQLKTLPQAAVVQSE